MNSTDHRLAFLIVEAEPGQGLSTRKLLIETAKHNVITAYSADEGIETFKRFPNVDVVVIDFELKDNTRIAKQIKQCDPEMRIVCLSSRIAAKADWADETVSSADPAELLKLLQEMGGRTSHSTTLLTTDLRGRIKRR